jgi:predicted nucleic acid-binding protein
LCARTHALGRYAAQIGGGPSLYRIVWTEELLQEIGRTLTKLGRTPFQVQRRLNLMRDHFPEAMVNITPELVAAIGSLPDADDRHVVAAAILGHADAIITANTKHFPAECLSRYNLVCQGPDEFLVHQYYLDPEVVLESSMPRRPAFASKDKMCLTGSKFRPHYLRVWSGRVSCPK